AIGRLPYSPPAMDGQSDYGIRAAPPQFDSGAGEVEPTGGARSQDEPHDQSSLHLLSPGTPAAAPAAGGGSCPRRVPAEPLVSAIRLVRDSDLVLSARLFLLQDLLLALDEALHLNPLS